MVGQCVGRHTEPAVEADVPVVEMCDGQIARVRGLVQPDLEGAQETEVDLLHDDAVEHAVRFVGQQIPHRRQRVGIVSEKDVEHVVRLGVLHDHLALVVRLTQVAIVAGKLHVEQKAGARVGERAVPGHPPGESRRLGVSRLGALLGDRVRGILGTTEHRRPPCGVGLAGDPLLQQRHLILGEQQTGMRFGRQCHLGTDSGGGQEQSGGDEAVDSHGIRTGPWPGGR